MRHVIQDTDVLLIYIILIVWLYFCQNVDDIHLFDIARCIVYGYMISNDLLFSLKNEPECRKE